MKMANEAEALVAKSLVPVQLDKKRNLLLNGNVMVSFEEATGKNLFQGDSLSKLSAKDFRALLWACLIHEDKKLTIDQVGEMINPDNIEDIANKLSEVWGVVTLEKGQPK